MSTAFLFPGQGTVFARATIAMARRSAVVGALLERASQALGLDLLRQLVRDGGVCARTEDEQPLVTAVVLGLHGELAAAGVRVHFVAGHSLGEIAAWSAAGCISPEAAVDLAVLRGRLMGRESARHPGAMAVVRDEGDGGDGRDGRDRPEHALEVGSAFGHVQLAAHNAPGEWVVTGDPLAIDAIVRVCSAVRLSVSGAWHSAFMAGAVDEFRQAMQVLPSAPASARMVCNHTGREVADANAAREMLANQLVQPIRWVRAMQTLRDAGVDTFVTVGPGKVLRSLVRKNLGNEVTILATETPAALERTIAALGAGPAATRTVNDEGTEQWPTRG